MTLRRTKGSARPDRRDRRRPSPVIPRLEALDRKRMAEAATVELKLARLRGEMVPAVEVAASWAEVVDAVREAVLGIAAEAVGSGVVAPEREAALDEIVRRALRGLADAR